MVADASYQRRNPAWWTRTEYSQSSCPKKYSSGRRPTRSIVRRGISMTAPEMKRRGAERAYWPRSISPSPR
jgi:hypothetical protein